ncbi:MAG: hypothetical protein GY797_03545 [Deltaproteobacteria bacterium]|nr:hypothetical protein [Deltaproteobacteria bacterium]
MNNPEPEWVEQVFGMVLCPGFVLIILFSHLLDMIGLGFFLALSITLGVLQRRRNLMRTAEQVVETLA